MPFTNASRIFASVSRLMSGLQTACGLLQQESHSPPEAVADVQFEWSLFPGLEVTRLDASLQERNRLPEIEQAPSGQGHSHGAEREILAARPMESEFNKFQIWSFEF